MDTGSPAFLSYKTFRRDKIVFVLCVTLELHLLMGKTERGSPISQGTGRFPEVPGLNLEG